MPAKAAKKENLDDLKQELDIDFHKITPEELYQRFQTHPENVSFHNIITKLFKFLLISSILLTKKKKKIGSKSC